MECCKRNCIGAWGGWSVCPVDCDGGCIDGNKTRTYTVTTPLLNGGAVCRAETGDSDEEDCTDCDKPCHHTPCATDDGFVPDDNIDTCSVECCKRDCVGAWGDWGACLGECNAQCSGGVMEQSYRVITQAAFGGSDCDYRCHLNIWFIFILNQGS